MVTDTLGHFIEREQIQDDTGQILKGLNYRRFRPTVIGSVAMDNGLDAAQKRADHASPPQTLAYANNPGNMQRVGFTVEAAQSKAIASARAGFSQRPAQEDVERLAQALDITHGAAAELIVGKRDKLFNGCVDDMNGRGPEIEGRRCGIYECCLVCINSVILERHLPRLITYYYHWLSMANEMDEAAWYDTHALNCAIVEKHLSKFDPELVESITREVLANPQPIFYRRFKQS
jgi:hypothetical protein